MAIQVTSPLMGEYTGVVIDASLSMRARNTVSRQLDKFVRAYTTLIRPSVEYMAPVWAGMISAEQSAQLKRQQVQALKNIFGPGKSAEKMRKEADVELLSRRREKISLKFANACLNNKRCVGWFKERPQPRYARRISANYPKYHEEIVRT